MKILDKLFKLPPVEQRKFLPFFFVSKFIKQGVRIERDGDYICYQAGAIVEKVGLLVLVIALIDLALGLGFFINLERISEKKVLFVAEWGEYVGPFSILVILFSYMRLKVNVDIAKDQIPIFMRKNAAFPKNR